MSEPAVQVRASATDCYVAGYPLVVSDTASQSIAGGRRNEFVSMRRDELEHAVGHGGRVLSSEAWLDLSAEPIVLSLPAGRRYFTVSLSDAWTNPLCSLGIRTTGAGLQKFLIAGPSAEKFDVDASFTRIAASGALVHAGVRIAVYDDADRASAAAFQRRIRIEGLSRFASGVSESHVMQECELSQETIVRAVDSMSGVGYFAALASLLPMNPPAFDVDLREKLDPRTLRRIAPAAAERAARLGRARIQSFAAGGARIGTWSTDVTCEMPMTRDHLRRAAVARARLDGDAAQDYVRLIADRDERGDVLDGRFHYRITFDRCTEPLARGPWLVSTRPSFRTQGAFAPHNAHGAIELHFARTLPNGIPESQYFPVAPGSFSIVLHVFWPDETILEGGWLPPGVELVR